MAVQLVAEQTITVGNPVTVEGRSPTQSYAVVFEDDGQTGYLYGLDFGKSENPIVDALQIYNVANVTDRAKPSVVQLVWSTDGLKAGLLINRYPHAIFDFEPQPGGGGQHYYFVWPLAFLTEVNIRETLSQSNRTDLPISVKQAFRETGFVQNAGGFSLQVRSTASCNRRLSGTSSASSAFCCGQVKRVQS